MKNVLFICLFFIPALCVGQQKKDNRITVAVSDTAGLFNRIVKFLYNRDYILDQKDPEGGLILTKERHLNNDRTFSVIYKILVNGDSLTVTGQVWSMLGSSQQQKRFDPIFYGGMKKSPLRLGWEEMDAIAKEFGRPVYSK